MVPTRWQENCKKSQSRVLRSSFPCFIEMSSQISSIYLVDRVTASNLKYFEILFRGNNEILLRNASLLLNDLQVLDII